MIAPRSDSPPPARKRYPGARPFSDSPEDRQTFFGRDADIDRLFDGVLGTRLLVLFGKSGLGKTSLLMAGVLPRLRKKPFLPVSIRLNGPGSPTKIVLAAVTDACKRAGAELTAGDSGGIWEFLRTSLIWKGDLLLTPVLVFDQFEEIFTLHDADFRNALAAELGALVSGIPPDHLLASGPRGAERGARLGEPPPEVKILLSLREEYLGTLQELSGAIPGLFQERVRLAPLAEEDARLAILRPAAYREVPGDTPFETPSFEYEGDALIEMLAFLRGESQIIEPFQLQLLCCHAEEMIAHRVRKTNAAATWRSEQPAGTATAEPGQAPLPMRITRADLGGRAGMEAVLRQFYLRVIGMLKRRDRRRARRLCEEGLLSATGKRLMLDQVQIESDYGMTAAALTTLVNERLLRGEPRLESLFYEISHDRLAESIEHSRRFRIPKTLRYTLRGAAAVALITIAALFWWNRQIDQARVAADRARSDAEELVVFLLGESLLEKLRPVGRNAILEEVQGRVEAYLDKASNQDQPGQLRTRGLALRNAGDILRSRGELARAIAKFGESAAVFVRLAAAEPKNPDPKVERARALYRLGDVLLDQGKVTESLKIHREALVLRQTLYDNRDHRDETTMDLADSNSSVGWMLNNMGQPRQALVHLDRARDLLRPMEASASRSPRLFKARHDAIDNRAESLGLIGDAPTTQRNAYVEARKITQEWVKSHPLSADARIRQVIAVSRLANEKMGQGAVKEAMAQYEEINRAIEELVRWDDTNAIWRRDFAATLILVAEGWGALKHYPEAGQAYDTALDLLTGLAETDPFNMSLKYDLSWLYQSRGKLALLRKQWQQAAADFTASERYIAEAARADQAFAIWQRAWFLVLSDLARARSGDGKHAEAAALLRRARDKVSTLIKAVPEMTALQQDLAAFYELEISVLKEDGKKDEAAALTGEKELAVMSALAVRPADVTLLNLAHIEHIRVGDAAKAAGRLEDALVAYRKGLDKIRRAVELDPDNVVLWDNLRGVHRRIGDAFYQGKRWPQAEGAYRNGLAPGEKASAIAPHRADLANQEFLLRLAIGDTLKAEGKPESALTEFERARERLDKAIATDGKVAVYFDNHRALQVRVAQIKVALKDMEGARRAYSEAAKAGSRAVDLADSAEKAEFANNVFFLHLEAGDWYAGRDDQAAALRSYEAARPWIEKAIEAAPRKSVYVNNLGILYVRIGSTKSTLGDATGALAAHGRALAALQRAARLDAKNAAYPDAMRLVYSATARLKENARDATGAEADLRTAVEAGQAAAALGNSAHYLDQAGFALFNLGAFYQRANSADKALNAYGDAVSQVERAIRLDANNALYHQHLSIVRRSIAVLREESGGAASARVDFEAAVRAARRATELASNDGANWQALYRAQWSLATNLTGHGDTSDTLPLMREALKSAEQTARLLPQDRAVTEDVAKLRDGVAERSR